MNRPPGEVPDEIVSAVAAYFLALARRLVQEEALTLRPAEEALK
jgi:hypothetical protein